MQVPGALDGNPKDGIMHLAEGACTQDVGLGADAAARRTHYFLDAGPARSGHLLPLSHLLLLPDVSEVGPYKLIVPHGDHWQFLQWDPPCAEVWLVHGCHVHRAHASRKHADHLSRVQRAECALTSQPNPDIPDNLEGI